MTPPWLTSVVDQNFRIFHLPESSCQNKLTTQRAAAAGTFSPSVCFTVRIPQGNGFGMKWGGRTISGSHRRSVINEEFYFIFSGGGGNDKKGYSTLVTILRH